MYILFWEKEHCGFDDIEDRSEVILSAQTLFVLHGGPLVDDDNLPRNFNLDIKKNGRVTLLYHLPNLPSCLPR